MRLLTSQLLLDHADLLLEVELLLAPIDLLAHPLPDAAVHVQDLDLALQDGGELFQPGVHLERLQHVLLIRDADVQVRGNDVGQPARIIDAADGQVHLRRHLFIELHVPVEEVHHAAHQRLHLCGRLEVLLQARHLHPQVWFGLEKALDHGPG